MLYMQFDIMYLFLVLPALLFSLWAQYMVKSSFKKYSQRFTSNNLTGAGAAYEVLRRNGVTGVRIERVPGNLTDHFDPRSNVICLSDSVYAAPTIAAVGVAAHEAGHAIQHAHNYAPMKLRAAIIPVTRYGSMLSMPLVMIGLVFELTGLINIGIMLFGAVVLFQLITLPVEFNASRRAMSSLIESGLLSRDEAPGARKVLSAAALTYVGALIVSIAQFARLFARSRRRRW